MKAVVVKGNKQGYEVRDIPDPKPERGEVVVQIRRAASVIGISFSYKGSIQG